jgi:trans-2-enoyl-CoA reductase
VSLCLSFEQTGQPSEVLKLVEHELGAIEPHDVRVRLRYAPINPADLNFIEGNYGRSAQPPCIPGHEASGEVAEVGSAVSSLKPGDKVIPLLGAGCWAQEMVAEEQHFARLPDAIDLIQASMLRVNPVTAWLLLKQFGDLTEGDWIVQNSGNSGVGRALIQIAKKLGIKTLSLVRRPELIAELKKLGADAVVLDSPEGLDEAKLVLKENQARPRVAANGVGSDSAIRLMELLDISGTMVTYGAMSRRSLKVPNKFLIFKDIHLQGLWVTRWLEHADADAHFKALHFLAEMMADGELHVAVDQTVPVSDFPTAIERAQESSRNGKVILDLQSS